MDVQECIRCHQPRPLDSYKRIGGGHRKQTCDPCVVAKRAATRAANKARRDAEAALEARRWVSLPPEPNTTELPRPVRLPDGWLR